MPLARHVLAIEPELRFSTDADHLAWSYFEQWTLSLIQNTGKLKIDIADALNDARFLAHLDARKALLVARYPTNVYDFADAQQARDYAESQLCRLEPGDEGCVAWTVAKQRFRADLESVFEHAFDPDDEDQMNNLWESFPDDLIKEV